MGRRYGSKVDTNQKEIVKAYRDAGASVEDLSAAGSGFPDLVVGFLGVTYLVEVIGPDKLKKFRKNDGLSDNQVEWHEAWRGHCCKVKNVQEALAVIGITVVPHRGEIT